MACLVGWGLVSIPLGWGYSIRNILFSNLNCHTFTNLTLDRSNPSTRRLKIIVYAQSSFKCLLVHLRIVSLILCCMHSCIWLIFNVSLFGRCYCFCVINADLGVYLSKKTLNLCPGLTLFSV